MKWLVKWITFVFKEQHMIASEWCQSCFNKASPVKESARRSSPPVCTLKQTTLSSTQWTKEKAKVTVWNMKFAEQRRFRVKPVTSTNPSCQSKSLRWTRKCFWPCMRAEPGGGYSHCYPLYRPHYTSHILAGHSCHIVSHVIFKSELESNCQNWPRVIIAQFSSTSWTSTARPNLKCGS